MPSPTDTSSDHLEVPSIFLAEHLQDVTEALAAARTQAEVLEIVLTPALQALGAVGGAVLLVDEAGVHLRTAAHQGYVPGVRTLWQDGLVEDQGPAADLLRTHEALYFEHAGELRVVYPDLEAQTGAAAAVATVVLPMFIDGRPLGTLVLDFKEPHTFTPQERQFLRTLASQCAVALGRADSLRLLERQLEERSRKIDEDAQAQVWSDDVIPDLVALIAGGLPAETPLFAEACRTRFPVFTDAWDAARERVVLSEEYGAVANYPLVVGGELRWMLAVGQSLDLALDRARQTRTVMAQRDARTQQLSVANQDVEAFSHSISHDLRTPVRHMTGFLRLARISLDGKLDERSARYLDVVEQAGARRSA